jgi:hypothetical protein
MSRSTAEKYADGASPRRHLRRGAPARAVPDAAIASERPVVLLIDRTDQELETMLPELRGEAREVSQRAAEAPFEAEACALGA